MKTALLALIIFPFLCSCQLLQQLERLELQVGGLELSVDDQNARLDVALESGETVHAELVTLKAGAEEMKAETAVVKATTTAVKEDVEVLEETATGVLGYGATGDAGGLVALGFGLLNYMRNRKYPNGKPPAAVA